MQPIRLFHFIRLTSFFSHTRVIQCYVLLLSMLFFASADAQNTLASAIRKFKPDTARVRAWIELAGHEAKINLPDSALVRLEEANNDGVANMSHELRSFYYWQKGEVLYKKKLYREFSESADSLLLLNPTGNPPGRWRAKGLYQKGFALIHQGDLTGATNSVKEGISIYQQLGDRYGEARGYQAIGNISFQGRQVAEAIRQYQRAIPIFLADGHEVDAAMINCSVSRAFIAGDQIDSAFTWNDKAKPVAQKFPENLELNYMVWQNEGDYLARSGQFEKADQAFQKAMIFARSMNTGYTLGGLLQVMSFAALNNNYMDKAVQYAEESRRIFEETGDYPMLQKSYQLLYTIYENKGDYKKAYESLDAYITVADSLFTYESMRQINDLNVKYETSIKEKQIAEQELDLARKNARLRNLIGGLLIAAALIALLLLLYFQRRKAYQQSLITLKKEQDISLLKALMTGEEKERSRLARELHDGLGGILAAAQMQISRLPDASNNSESIEKAKAVELVSKAASESRRIAHNLLPETLLRYGLDESLREYTQSIRDSGLLKVDFQSEGLDQRLDQSVELSIYRIIQELLNNIIKHAGATEALVQVHRRSQVLSITVEDNGRGFAPDKTERSGIGLNNIESRISYLNGSIDIRSDQQRGTSVFIEIQLQKNGENTV